MGLASEMKNLSENILASFKQRIKENEELTKGNEELLKEVQKTLDGFRKDHQEMAAVINANAIGLRKGLAQGEKERLSTFKGIMDGIKTTIFNIQKEVVEIQSSTFKMMNGFANERGQMSEKLNKSFAKSHVGRMQDEKLRIKEFDALMKNINGDIKNINDEVLSIFKSTNNMLEKFEKEHLEMSVELRGELNKNLAERVSYTKSLLLGFQKRLTEMSEENQQLAKAMRKELANSQSQIKNSEKKRLVDYNVVMKKIQLAIKGIQLEVKQIQKASSSIIVGYSQDRSQAVSEWNKMQDAMAQLKKTGSVKHAKKDENKAETKKEIPVETILKTQIEDKPIEIIKETSFIAEPSPVTPSPKETKTEITVKKIEKTPVKAEPEPKPVVPMTLEEKILEYINKHPKGVRVSEMELPLGETRMKLGFVAKNLWDSGKIQKVDKTYFPLK